MRKIIILFFCVVTFVSCDSSKKQEVKKENEELVMYEYSEMALLMEEMFEANEKLKNSIVNNKDLGSFSEKYLNIHSAVLTNPKDRNATFEAFSIGFIENQKAVFSADSTEVKEQFNIMVNSCVACHETNCTGPIPRIKKLLIK